MRIHRLVVANLPPIRRFEMADLSSPVIVAGANGSGKTRLKEAIADTFRSASSPRISLTIRSTRDEEQTAWNADTLDVEQGTNSASLQQYMNTRSRGGSYVGTCIQIDSDRSVTAVKFAPITLATPDPFDTEMNLTYFLSPFSRRWPELVNKIYQKAASQDLKIAASVRLDPTAIGHSYLDANPDPFVPYQQVFAELLPDKTLEPIDPKQPREFHYKIGAAGPFAFTTLSSGEQEVVKVAFDLIWKKIRHSVILIDEPELHLHPTLAFRLIETIKELGDRTNQLILFTHSPDLISTYHASGNVYFIDLDEASANQGKRLSDLHNDHSETARAIGANLGLFAVGKKLVFVEGSEASVDRLTYHKVAQRGFAEASLLPMGSVKNINALRLVSEELQRAIFGVDLFMLRDRDGLTDKQVEALERNPRFRVLPCRHVENFFFDSDVLRKVAEQFCLSPEKADKNGIDEALTNAARKSLHGAVVGDIKQLIQVEGALDPPRIKGVEEMDADELEDKLVRELTSAANAPSDRFSEGAIKNLVNERRELHSAALRDGTWKGVFPGKAVLARFVADHWHVELGRVRQAYVDIALREKPEALQPIRDIFEGFRALT